MFIPMRTHTRSSTHQNTQHQAIAQLDIRLIHILKQTLQTLSTVRYDCKLYTCNAAYTEASCCLSKMNCQKRKFIYPEHCRQIAAPCCMPRNARLKLPALALQMRPLSGFGADTALRGRGCQLVAAAADVANEGMAASSSSSFSGTTCMHVGSVASGGGNKQHRGVEVGFAVAPQYTTTRAVSTLRPCFSSLACTPLASTSAMMTTVCWAGWRCLHSDQGTG